MSDKGKYDTRAVLVLARYLAVLNDNPSEEQTAKRLLDELDPKPSLTHFKRVRIVAGLSQRELAYGAGIGRSTISRLEGEEWPNPSDRIARAIQRTFGFADPRICFPAWRPARVVARRKGLTSSDAGYGGYKAWQDDGGNTSLVSLLQNGLLGQYEHDG